MLRYCYFKRMQKYIYGLGSNWWLSMISRICRYAKESVAISWLSMVQYQVTVLKPSSSDVSSRLCCLWSTLGKLHKQKKVRTPRTFMVGLYK